MKENQKVRNVSVDCPTCGWSGSRPANELGKCPKCGAYSLQKSEVQNEAIPPQRLTE
jgi:predicted nucleic-acid-binding Zn-ribbon protein